MHYCQHVKSLELSKNLYIKTSKFACTECQTLSPHVWLCLAKGCSYQGCELNKLKHMYEHVQGIASSQAESAKKGHCIFLNPANAEIRCLTCRIEIYDIAHLTAKEKELFQPKLDPLVLRERYLPKSPIHSPSGVLRTTTTQIESSLAHRKSNAGLCGVAGDPQTLVISSVLQYYSQIPYYQHLLRASKLHSNRSENEKFVWQLAEVVKRMWSGEIKVAPAAVPIFPTQEFTQTVFECLPKLRGYRRKDPYELFSLILNKLHNQFKYYESVDIPMETSVSEQLLQDEWEILRNSHNRFREWSPITDPLQTEVKYTLECSKCKREERSFGHIMGVKLEIPKAKRVSKEIQKEFEKHHYESPTKRQRKLSLFERIIGKPEPEVDLTILELMFHFMKILDPPSEVNRNCEVCKSPMTKNEAKFNRLPKLLFLQVPRLNKDGYTYNTRAVSFPTNSLDLAGFVESDYQGQTTYEFCSAICLSSENEYITVSRHNKNKQLYVFKNESCRLSNGDEAVPYMLCYSIRNKHRQFYKNIKSNIEITECKDYPLPDFWLEQLKNFQPGPLLNQRICKHHNCKPRFQSKCQRINYLPKEIYEALIEKFGGRLFTNRECQHCKKELSALSKRRKLQKQFVTKLDGYQCKQHCMMSCYWLNRWTKYLYGRREINYFVKDLPPPGSIINSVLLEDHNRCKPNLKKGEDFRIVNYYVWLFFKEMYGGGPEIQYRTKGEQQSTPLDEQVQKQIELRVAEMKQLLQSSYYLKYFSSNSSREWQDVSPCKSLRKKNSSSFEQSSMFSPKGFQPE